MNRLARRANAVDWRLCTTPRFPPGVPCGARLNSIPFNSPYRKTSLLPSWVLRKSHPGKEASMIRIDKEIAALSRTERPGLSLCATASLRDATVLSDVRWVTGASRRDAGTQRKNKGDICVAVIFTNSARVDPRNRKRGPDNPAKPASMPASATPKRGWIQPGLVAKRIDSSSIILFPAGLTGMKQNCQS